MDPDPDLTIVLLGKAGVGKSASGNKILGQAAFKAELAFNPVTTEICEATGEVFGKLIRVVDTPGILETDDTDDNIQTFCQKLLQSSRRCLFLVVVSVGRFTREDRKALRAAVKAIRPLGSNKVQSYLLFTNGEKLKDKTLEQFITESKTGFLPDVVKMFAGAYHLFKNEDGDQEQVRELLLKTGHLRTQHPPASPDKNPDLTIVLLGKSGVGKSASGNTILGQPAFESRLSFKPVTTEICEATGRVFGKQIRVVDTPGILDTSDTEEKVKAYCQDLLQSSRPCLFLVLVRVGRFTEEEQRAVEAATRVLGDQGLKKSYLLFTGGDMLKNMSLTEFIFEQEDGSLPDVVMKKFRGAYHLFNNEDRDQEQVRSLLLKTGYLRTAAPEESARLQERRIVLLGRPGGGKSASGNTILGSNKFKSDCDFDSVSTETVSESAEVEGRRVTVVDTPGFTDEVLTPEQLYIEIMKTLVQASPGPHAFVIVVKIDRMSKKDAELLQLLPKLFGDDASKYTMVLFTGGDKLEGRSVDDKIRANKHVTELVSMCGGRYCVFDNTQTGNRQQVRQFLNIVDEMVTANKGEHYTSLMFEMAATFVREERNLSDPSGGANRASYGSANAKNSKDNCRIM